MSDDSRLVELTPYEWSWDDAGVWKYGRRVVRQGTKNPSRVWFSTRIGVKQLDGCWFVSFFVRDDGTVGFPGPAQTFDDLEECKRYAEVMWKMDK